MILAGGTGSRMRPLTRVTNKHLLPVWKAPMIYYPLYTLRSFGVTDIMVTVGGDSIGDVMRLLGSGARFGLQLSYRVQDEAGGIAQAIGLGKDFAKDSAVAVVLGDNIFDEDYGRYRRVVEACAEPASIFVKRVPDPQRFGVVEWDAQGRPVSILEKPAVPPSEYAVTGFYVYPPEVFEVTETLTPSARGELEVTDLNNHFLRRGELAVHEIEGFWSDAGTFESCFRATSHLRDHPIPWDAAFTE